MKRKPKKEATPALKTYRVNVSAYISQTVEVQAATPEQAAHRGYEAAHFGLCHQCSSEAGDVGDPSIALVMDMEGNEILTDQDGEVTYAQERK